MIWLSRVLFVVLILFLSVGCGQMLSPHVVKESAESRPATPTPKLVDDLNIPYKPVPKPGEGIVVVDIVDYGGKVSLIESINKQGITMEGYGAIGAGGGVDRAGMQLKMLGSAPCAFALPFGSHQLLFEAPGNGNWPSSTDIKEIVVTETPQQITHVMSRYYEQKSMGENNMLALVVEATGWTLALFGGLDMLLYDEDLGYLFGGPTTLGVGAATVLLGGLIYDGGSTVIKSRPSASVSIPIDLHK